MSGFDYLVQRLIEARVRQGLTQTSVAERLSSPRSRISNWEHRTREPSWADVEAWAACLGLEVEIELYGPGAAGTSIAAMARELPGPSYSRLFRLVQVFITLPEAQQSALVQLAESMAPVERQ